MSFLFWISVEMDQSKLMDILDDCKMDIYRGFLFSGCLLTKDSCASKKKPFARIFEAEERELFVIYDHSFGCTWRSAISNIWKSNNCIISIQIYQWHQSSIYVNHTHDFPEAIDMPSLSWSFLWDIGNCIGIRQFHKCFICSKLLRLRTSAYLRNYSEGA